MISGLLGILLGVIVVLVIQFTIGNPFIWLEEKWRNRK